MNRSLAGTKPEMSQGCAKAKMELSRREAEADMDI